MAGLAGLFVKRVTAGLFPQGAAPAPAPVCVGGLQKLFSTRCFSSKPVCVPGIISLLCFFVEQNSGPAGLSVDCTSGGHNN